MRRKAMAIAACACAISLTLGSVPAYADTLDGGVAVAGVSSMFTQIVAKNDFTNIDDTVISAALEELEEKEEADEEEDKSLTEDVDYENIAIAQVNDYVNIRKKPSEDSKILGKLYADCAGTVIEQDGDWTKIESGSVTGYVKSEFLSIGDKEVIEEACTKLAIVNTTTLYLRASNSTDSAVLDMIPIEEELRVLKYSGGNWVKVKFNGTKGFVAKEYVDIITTFDEAESIAEEKARLEAEAAAKAAAAAAASSSSSSSSSGSSSSSSSSSSSDRHYDNPSGYSGSAVANYACQFVGNPYVYGGTSLTNGCDCSGFVMSVYAAFGISLPHSSYSLRSVGYSVSTSDMQPGDIICYSGHVAIYVGNNTIVHASTPSTGIKYTSPANYRSIICVRRIF
ncbi:MAG: C40 family peptidase [Eubacterium sp.]|nr:C40 family peptidase [Eubacterium sp.]